MGKAKGAGSSSGAGSSQAARGKKGGTTGTREKRRKVKFLEELTERGSVFHACKASGLGRSTAYRWRGEDEAFRDSWDEALETVRDELEASAMQRAIHGTVKEVFDKGGRKVGEVQTWETGLTIFMLKHHRPKRYLLADLAGGDADRLARDIVAAAAEMEACMDDE